MALEIRAGAIIERGMAIKEDFYLRFPFLFEFGGELLDVSRMIEVKQIRICLPRIFSEVKLEGNLRAYPVVPGPSTFRV